MYIEYSYNPADAPDGVNTIEVFKTNIVKDLADVICNMAPSSALSDNCMYVDYYGNDSGWEIDEIMNDNEISIKSKSTEDYYKKFIIIKSSADTSKNNAGFTVTKDPKTGNTEYSTISTATLFLNFETYDYNPNDNKFRIIKQSKTLKFNYYASGGIIRISCSKNHLIVSGNNDDFKKYQNGIGVMDYISYDDIDDSFSRFVFFDTKTWNNKGPAFSSVVSSVKKYNTSYTTNEYDIEIYDLEGVINFYNSDTDDVDKKFQYANHVYVNNKYSSNYLIGGNCSKLSNMYVLPKNNIGKPLEEITIDGKRYVVWAMLPNDFTVNNNRLLILKE